MKNLACLWINRNSKKTFAQFNIKKAFVVETTVLLILSNLGGEFKWVFFHIMRLDKDCLLFEHEEYIYALLKASNFIDLVFFGMCPIFVDKSNFVYRWLLYIKSNNIEKKFLGLIFIHLKLTFNH